MQITQEIVTVAQKVLYSGFDFNYGQNRSHTGLKRPENEEMIAELSFWGERYL